MKEEARHPTLRFASSDDANDDSSIRRSEEARREFSLEELRRQKQEEREELQKLKTEMRREELEALISSYEGNTIGWLMRFLTEEMVRLKEIRKLHLYTMVAKLERWHREAAEAGLRQKENCMRQTYENLYKKCDQMNQESAAQLLKTILDTDIKDYAEQEAVEYSTNIAKELDIEIQGWLDSWQDVQNPLNYETLRHALKDIIMPDAEKILYRLETDNLIGYIINNVVMKRVYKGLEAYDVSFSFVSDLVDRIIDNDIYLDSPDCSSECDCGKFCFCTRAKIEAMAILRKALRRSVPGRRWRTVNERVVYENIRDVLDEVFEKAIPKGSIIEVEMSDASEVAEYDAHTDLVFPEHDIVLKDLFDSPAGSINEIELKCLTTTPATPQSDTTRSLKDTEYLLLLDPDELSVDKTLISKSGYIEPESIVEPSEVHTVPSTHDITSVYSDFNKMPVYAQTSSDELLQRLLEEELQREIGEEEDLGEDFEVNTEEEEYRRQEIIETEMEELSRESEEEKLIEEIEEILSAQNEAEYQSIPVKETREERAKQIQIKKQQVKYFEKTEATYTEPHRFIEEKDTDGVMEVSFIFDPELEYSVPVPSGHSFVDGAKRSLADFEAEQIPPKEDTTEENENDVFVQVSVSYENMKGKINN